MCTQGMTNEVPAFQTLDFSTVTRAITTDEPMSPTELWARDEQDRNARREAGRRGAEALLRMPQNVPVPGPAATASVFYNDYNTLASFFNLAHGDLESSTWAGFVKAMLEEVNYVRALRAQLLDLQATPITRADVELAQPVPGVSVSICTTRGVTRISDTHLREPLIEFAPWPHTAPGSN